MGGIFGLDLARLAEDPTRLDIDTALPPVRLRGRLERRQPDSYSGVLSATVPPRP